MTNTIEANGTVSSIGYDAALDRAGRRVDRALRTAPGVIRAYTGHLAGARGKMIRAAALLACAADDGGGVPEDAVGLAAGVELLHLATLVHDDVIDDADTRRGIPTLQRKFGKRTAVICGDYLLSLALRTATAAADRDADRYRDIRLPDYVGRIALGELWQQLNRNNLDLTVYRYLRIIGGKTAALFEATYRGGALLHTRDERLVGLYAALGRSVGMIFQLTDDCIDFELDAQTAKKPVRSDFEQGVVTLPVIHALGRDAQLRGQALRGLLTADELGERVRAAGGIDYTRRMAARYYERAAQITEKLGVSQEKAERLNAILDRAYHGIRRRAEST